MCKFLVFTLLSACLIGISVSQGTDNATSSEYPTDVTTSVADINSTVSESVTTEAPVTSQSPTEANVTSQSPTEANVTSQSPTEANVTTQSPTEAPATTPKPTEVPKPEVGKWSVTDDNTTCIRVEMAVQFEIKTAELNETVNLSPNATVGGTCNGTDGEQVLVLSDQEGPNMYSLMFIFVHDKSHTYVQNISFSFTTPEGQQNVKVSGQYFAVNNGRSYLCKADSSIKVESVTMHLSSVHLQAYGAKDNKGYALAEVCEADDNVSDIVPIAVGCALAGLVVVILIAYLVGRRQSRQKGYQSV